MGFSENTLQEKEKSHFGLGTTECPIKAPLAYKVLRRGDVPSLWWKNESLALERYVQNKENRIYRFYVFQHAMVLSEAYNVDQIKKMRVGIRRTDWALVRHGENVTSLTRCDVFNSVLEVGAQFANRSG